MKMTRTNVALLSMVTEIGGYLAVIYGSNWRVAVGVAMVSFSNRLMANVIAKHHLQDFASFIKATGIVPRS